MFSDEEAEQLAAIQSRTFASSCSAALPFKTSLVAHFSQRYLPAPFPEGTEPQTEVDLISAWWARPATMPSPIPFPQRQRALIDIAEKGVRNLGKGIPARDLKDATMEHVAALKADQIIRDERGGAFLAFTHDIFFEWAFFRLLIDLGDELDECVEAAGSRPCSAAWWA